MYDFNVTITSGTVQRRLTVIVVIVVFFFNEDKVMGTRIKSIPAIDTWCIQFQALLLNKPLESQPFLTVLNNNNNNNKNIRQPASNLVFRLGYLRLIKN